MPTYHAHLYLPCPPPAIPECPQVEHLLHVALHRFGRHELSRAWNTWHTDYTTRRRNFQIAALRFRSMGLYAALRTVRLPLGFPPSAGCSAIATLHS